MAALGAIGEQARAAASTAPACSRRCRRARRATRSTARSGISKPSAPAGRPTRSPACAAPQPLTTAYTISLGTPEAMAEAARKAAGANAARRSSSAAPAIPSASPRCARAAPQCRTDRRRQRRLDRRQSRGQSRRLRRGRRHAGRAAAAGRRTTTRSPRSRRPMPICADESVHDRALLAALVGRYDAVNIKLDKTGGLTEALAMARGGRAARASPSWSAAWSRRRCRWRRPCWWRSARRVVDLDGPLLLAKDRPDGLRYDGSLVYPPTPALVGMMR